MSILAPLNYQERDLDLWKEVVKKIGDIKATANLEPPSYVREIDSKCPKSHYPSAKKDNKDTYEEPRNEVSKDKDKAKFYIVTFAN